MNKKLLVLVILCLLTLPLGMFPDEKIRTIEFIAMERTGYDPYPPYSYRADIPENEEFFESGSVLTLHVPPMPKYDTIFFELEARCTYTWSGYIHRKTYVSVYFLMINPDIIPENIEVWGPNMGIPWDTVQNNASNIGTQHYDRIIKFIMKRNSSWQSGYIGIYYKTGDLVPDEVAIPIVNALIDNGYDVEIRTGGTIQGVQVFRLGWASLEITRLSK